MNHAWTYRKRPMTVTAMQWDGTQTDAVAISLWVRDNGGQASYVGTTLAPCISLRTSKGLQKVIKGDWVLLDAGGEFSYMDPAEFDATYERTVPS